jgi:hypothetical protein
MAAEMRFLLIRMGGPAQLLEQGRTNRSKIVQTLVRIGQPSAFALSSVAARRASAAIVWLATDSHGIGNAEFRATPD